VIEDITSIHKEFSQKHAEVASHLDCLAAEAMQRESNPPDPLPKLGAGPDEVFYSPPHPTPEASLVLQKPPQLHSSWLLPYPLWWHI